MAIQIAAILEAINMAIKVTQAVIQTGQDAAPFIAAIRQTFSGTDVTQEQLDALEARIDALSAELQEPLPPEE